MNFPKSLLIFCLSVGIFSCQSGCQSEPVRPATPPAPTVGKPQLKTQKEDNLNPVSDEVLRGVEKQLADQMPGKEVTATPATDKLFTPAQVDSIKGTLPGMKRPKIGSKPLTDQEKLEMWDNTILKQMTGVLDILCKQYKKGTLDRDKKLQHHESGLKTFPVKAGGGPRVRPDSYVAIKYVAMTVDGQRFDANFMKDRYFRFKMGAGEVIPGIEEALLGVGAGAKGVFFIPPHLAFGDKGRVGVPPNTEVAYLIALDEVN